MLLCQEPLELFVKHLLCLHLIWSTSEWILDAFIFIQSLCKSFSYSRLLSLYLKMMKSLNCLRRYSRSCRKHHCTQITLQMALRFFGLPDHLTSDQASKSGKWVELCIRVDSCITHSFSKLFVLNVRGCNTWTCIWRGKGSKYMNLVWDSDSSKDASVGLVSAFGRNILSPSLGLKWFDLMIIRKWIFRC